MKNRLFSLAASACLSAVVPIASAHSGSDLSPQTQIPGYTFGQKSVATAPYTLKDLESLKKALLFTDEDVLYLRKSKEILAIRQMQFWMFGTVSSHLRRNLSSISKIPRQPARCNYLNAVRKRFGQWILDTADANYDQTCSTINMRLVFVTPRSKKIKRITLKACLK